jgi:transcription termination/antitermination protein NusG
MKEWFAVYTKLNCERKVSTILTKKGITNLLPLMQNDIQKRKNGSLPVFPNMVFLHLELENIQKVLQIPEVINFIYWLGKPASIKEVEIEVIQRFILEHKNVSIQKIEVNREEGVRIITSIDEKTTQKSLPKIETVKITLPSLGFALTGERQKTYVKVILDQSIAV